MSVLFDRHCELHVFVNSKKYIIKNLDMDFDIIATDDSKPNIAKISVYNLSETTRNLFSESTRGMEFWAGYGDELGMIFRGSWDPDSSTVKHEQIGPTWATHLETGDGLKEFQEAIFEKTYPKGMSVKYVIHDIASSFALPVVLDYDENLKTTSARTFSCKAWMALNEITSHYMLKWSIQHGTVEILDFFSPPKNDSQATLLTPSTGIIGTPTITDKGINVKTLLLSNIQPSRLIQIGASPDGSKKGNIQKDIKGKISKKSEGLFIVNKIKYFGNNYGGAFNCLISSRFKQ